MAEAAPFEQKLLHIMFHGRPRRMGLRFAHRGAPKLSLFLWRHAAFTGFGPSALQRHGQLTHYNRVVNVL